MVKKHSNKLYTILSSVLLVLIILTAVMILGVLKINEVSIKAANTILTVNKKVSVDTYVYGEDVVYDEANSNLAVDKYIVEIGSTVYIRAVNDTALFSQWTIKNNGVETKSTNVHETITVNGEVTVSLDVVDPTGFVNGKLKYDMIPVTEANHLLAIQKILEAGPSANVSTLVDQYDLLFSTNNYYRTALNKIEFITTNKLFSVVQNGYYGINNNLSVFSQQFKGIGNSTTPFKGVFVGVDEGTSIISTIIQDEIAGTNNYGLFSVLDQEAVLLNLDIQTAIGIKQSQNSIATTSVINAGGVAGTFNNAFMYNTRVKTIISISSGYSTINAGGIAGTMSGGLNSVNKSIYDASLTNWIINNNSANSNHVGYIAGNANGVYLKDFHIDTTNADIMLTSHSADTDTTNSIGTLYGTYNGTRKSEISNVLVTTSGSTKLQSIVEYGASFVGGAIGNVKATNELTVGDINFINTSDKNVKFISQSLDSNSRSDVYSGGLFANITGTVNASDEFKVNIKSIPIDDKFIKKGEYIFSGNYIIESTYHGYINTNLDYGRCVAGGLVGKGYFNILGSVKEIIDENEVIKNSEILIHDEKGKLSVIATQSQTVESQTKNGNGDIEHCIASLTFGLFTQNTNNIKITDIDIYATNVLVNAVRENGSKGMGDVRVAGFNGYSNGTSYDDINVYINHSEFKLESLSYEITNQREDENNAYCGGVFADVENATVANSKLSGYDIDYFTEIGNTLYMMSIQNTIAKGGDYRDENYIGGIIGQVKQVYTISGLVYNGSETTEDAVILQGHEDPDSCFSGGLIGLIKGNDEAAGTTFKISNCKVKNATVEAHATVAGDDRDTSKKNYDIMLGGAFGALYNNNGNFNSTFNNIYVYDSDIRGNANEQMEINAAGIIGAVTWSSTHEFNNCYVYGSKVTANSNANINTVHDQAYAAGIVAHLTGVTLKVNNCAVIDSILSSSGDVAETAGFIREEESSTVTITNCYINSTLLGNSVNVFGDDSPTYSGRNYYTSKTSTATINGLYKINNQDLPVTAANTAITSVISAPTGNKVYPVLSEGTDFRVNNAGTNNNVTISKIGENDNAVDVLSIWINATSAGSTENPTNMTLEKAHDAGWFMIETINVYSGTNTFTDLDHLDDNEYFVYTDGENDYVYSSGSYDGTNSNRYLEHVLDDSILVRGGYAEKGRGTVKFGTTDYNIIKDIDVNVYEGMHNIKLKFSVTDMPTYEVVLLDSSGNPINKTPNEQDDYGTYEFIYIVESGNKINYTLNYYPNPEMSGTTDLTFYIAFKIGRTTTNTYYDKSLIKINLSPNVRKLEKLVPANYSPSLNIRDENIGTEELPYILDNSTITKFIPVFSRVNDLEHILYDADTNVEYATFSETGNNTSIRSNGELTIDSQSDTKFTVIAKSKINTSESVTVYCISPIQTVYGVNYSSIGADVSSIGKATAKCEFYFDLEIYSSYSSLLNADNFKITIGSSTVPLSTYMLYDSKGHKINDDPETTDINEALVGREGETHYTIIIPRGSINGTINIDIHLDVTYNVTFVLNCSKFNPGYDGPLSRTYKVISGHLLRDYFSKTSDIYLELKQWVDDATLFGYAFNGFYLVDNADSLPAYGFDLDTLAKGEETVHTSLTFYACWSFLIELVEAPGTHITTSFADSFMKEYYDVNKVESTIKIPINSNRGYIFTIEKDSGFIGEAEVRAFSLTKTGEEIITDEIAIEKYHENQYLYYIPPEAITGYLVIATSVGNSELIVGENSASISENLLPYDGVYTFKYIVNHRNEPNYQSFIYNSSVPGNKDASLNYNRDVMVEFFEQTFSDSSLGQKPGYLPKGTDIEVYYHLYVNGVETKNIVGSYVVNDDLTSRVFLKDFTLINNDSTTRAFEEIKFKDLLGNNAAVTEVYYFSITPPNGITLDNNKIINYIVNAGYYYNEDGNYLYIDGKRTIKNFVNKPLQGELEVIIMNESALHQNLYSVSPSRETKITIKDEENLKFNYTDITDYHIMDLTVTNTVEFNGALKLKGTIGSRSTLTSSRLGFNIKDVEIVAGYNKGTIDVYGSTDGLDWHLVETINVESEEYLKYIVFFDEKYSFFKLDNTSGNDIHIKDMLVADLQTAIHYEINFEETKPTVNGTTLEYQLVNEIVGDTRHDSKKFMLAVQIYDNNGKLVLSIDPSVHLDVDGTKYYSNDEGYVGKSVMFFNLSDIKDAIGTNSFDFDIVVPDSYDGYQLIIQLVEAKMSFKPAMDEVRQTINLLKQAIVSYEYKYIGGAESPGLLDNPNDTKVTGDVVLKDAEDGELVFGGWYLDEQLTQKIDALTMAYANNVIYGAFYKQGTSIYEVTFVNDSSELYKVSLPTGGKMVMPEFNGVTPVGMKFDGWEIGSKIYGVNEVFEMGNENVILKAHFTARQYTVTFNVDSTRPFENPSFSYGTEVNFTKIPSRIGYKFVKWDTELGFTMPAYDIVITAIWEPITYKVVFNANGGNGTMLDQNIAYDVPTALYKNLFTRDGYKFLGWAIGPESDVSYLDLEEVLNLRDEQDEEIPLYAVWTDTMVVTFEENGGTEVLDVEVKLNSKVTKPADPTREHYVFAGWYTDSSFNFEYDFNNPVFDAMTLYAKWEAVKYTITFKDGETTLGTITDAGGSTIDLNSVPTLTATNGYIVAWDKEIPSIMPYSDLIITKRSIQLTYDLGNGANTHSNPTSYVYGSTVNNFSDPTNLVTGYKFCNWEYNGNTINNLNQIIIDNSTTEVVIEAKYYVLVTVKNNVYHNNYYNISVTATSTNSELYDTSLNELANPYNVTVNKQGGTTSFYVVEGTELTVSATYKRGNSTYDANDGIDNKTINAPTTITFTRE